MVLLICRDSLHSELHHYPMKQWLLTPGQPSLLCFASQIKEVTASELTRAHSGFMCQSVTWNTALGWENTNWRDSKDQHYLSLWSSSTNVIIKMEMHTTNRWAQNLYTKHMLAIRITMADITFLFILLLWRLQRQTHQGNTVGSSCPYTWSFNLSCSPTGQRLKLIYLETLFPYWMTSATNCKEHAPRNHVQ